MTLNGVMVCTTDASSTGYGGHWGSFEFSGPFNGNEVSWHINVKELWSIVHAAERFAAREWFGHRVLFMSEHSGCSVCQLTHRSHPSSS